MKPKDLKPVFSWDERRPLLQDRVLFVPRHYQNHKEFGAISFQEIFGNQNPVVIEYCSGNGSWILEKAKTQTDLNWIAVERRFDRTAKIWSKLKNDQMENLFVVCGEAQDFTLHYLKPKSISSAYVNFPDPWPKGKHAKHRLLQTSFFMNLRNVLIDSGNLVIATDHRNYVDQILKEVRKDPLWKSCFPDPFFIKEWPEYGSSYFESLWRSKGLEIHYLQFGL